jgi:hypothetical protein
MVIAFPKHHSRVREESQYNCRSANRTSSGSHASNDFLVSPVDSIEGPNRQPALVEDDIVQGTEMLHIMIGRILSSVAIRDWFRPIPTGLPGLPAG